MKLKEQEDAELETNRLLSILQHGAKEVTPNSNPQRTTTNIPYDIKRPIAAKRKARSTWQRTHTPDSRRIFNQYSNKLKSKLQEVRNKLFKQYISNLKRDDNYIWKPIKNRTKPTSTSPQYVNTQHLQDHGQKATRKKLIYMLSIFRSFLFS
jgi:hypothetical protein